MCRRAFQLGTVPTLGKEWLDDVAVGPESAKGYDDPAPLGPGYHRGLKTGNNQLEIEVWNVKQLTEDEPVPEE
ncbi:hypothetical protein [Bifidobacterium xylocopae]|uniref:Uncharacterized protein n=1 Tax=Bifidobacterium xylocopae TaxID=2493119 RepID=A0A366KD71_9BIFI|nr:hypothetical protein [Bifidobacterium xylocopae]RBP99695.1 hypothetical protein CRD59_02935 [Bifidobacterium xylocopae]